MKKIFEDEILFGAREKIRTSWNYSDFIKLLQKCFSMRICIEWTMNSRDLGEKVIIFNQFVVKVLPTVFH